MRDRDVGEMCIDDLYNLVVVIPQLLKLEVKVVQPGNKLTFGRVASDDDELLLEDTFDDKTAAVLLQPGLTEHLVEADMLLFIEPERVFITRRSGLLSGLVGQFSVCIHNIDKKRSRLGSGPGLAERAPLSDKTQFVGQRYSSLFLCRNKSPRRKFFCENFEKPPLRRPRTGLSRLQYYNRRAPKKSPPNGLERTVADIGTEASRAVVYCGRNKRKRL